MIYTLKLDSSTDLIASFLRARTNFIYIFFELNFVHYIDINYEQIRWKFTTKWREEQSCQRV